MAESERHATPDGQTGAAPTAAAAANQNEASDTLDLLRRERADFLNYKRRVERERATDREIAESSMLRALIPFLDDLDRALSQLPPDLERHPWARGVALGHDRLLGAFGALGVSRIGAEGEPYDPIRHEALFFDTQPGITDKRVSSVVRPGYRRGDRLVRAAQVGVVGPAESALVNDASGASNADTTELAAAERERP